MKPFLRPVDRARLAPVGWVSEPAGRWADREVEVVYDPQRHDVTFLRHRVSDDVRQGMSDIGYRRTAVDGDCEMWVRDRHQTLADALERVDRHLTRAPERTAGVEMQARGL
jgi:hypothetical protein